VKSENLRNLARWLIAALIVWGLFLALLYLTVMP